MSKILDQLKTGLRAFERSPEGIGTQFRLDFAKIIWNGLRRKGWTQGQLALKAELADSVVSNLIHGNKNCTLDTVGKVIHALDTRAVLIELGDHIACSTNSRLMIGPITCETTGQDFEDLKSEQTEIDITILEGIG